MSKGRGIHLGAHIILGLPGESKAEIINHAKKLSELPLETLKIHHLQIVKHTIMANQFRQNPRFFTFFSLREYTNLVVDFLERLNPNIFIERFFIFHQKSMKFVLQHLKTAYSESFIAIHLNYPYHYHFL